MGTFKKTQCDMCAVSCGIEVEVENDEIVNVRPDPDSPRTSNYMCRKGRAAKFFVHNPDRLNYPMKKVGDHFERISWEQAYKEIAEKANAILKKHGPRAFAFCGGTLASEQSEAALGKTFVANAIGSQYWYCPIGLEFMGTWWSHGKVLGHQMYFTEPDEKRNEAIILWGSNSYVSHQMADARKVIRKFSQDPEKMVITVDPRLSETARMSDLHIPLRNGTDALFLRALIALILKKGWQHQDYLDRWAGDWEQAKKWYEAVDIEGSMRVCGISMELAERFAHVLTHKKWGMHQDLGVFCSRHNTVACYLLLVLMAVCGVLLMPGGCIVQDVFAGRGESSDENDPNTWRTVETGKFPVLGVYPVAVIPAEIQSKKPDHLRAMFFTQTNPARSYPNSKAMEAAFKDLELMVVVDIVETETTRLADYVLPAKSSYEAYAFSTFQGGFPEVGCWLKHPVIDKQIGERREGGQIWTDLAREMGLLPKIPNSVYKAAEKAAQTGDRIPYFLKLLPLAAKSKRNMDLLPLIVAETLGKAMGSTIRALMWAALMIAPVSGTGMVERAGIKPLGLHPVMEKIPKLKDLCLMDACFQLVDDTPQGAIIAITDPERLIHDHIYHKDKKLHLWCKEVDAVMPRLTPEQEERELTLDGEFPMILSSGRHQDTGVNAVMRNPRTYVYRDMDTALMHPDDAERLGVTPGSLVRVTTKTGTGILPAEVSYQAAPNYVMIPHHFGFTVEGKTIGVNANDFTASEDIDEITGNPLLRYIPCRVEALEV